MKYLRRVLNATLRDKWHRSEICKANMSSHFPESLDPSLVNSAMCPKCPGKEWRTKSFRLHPRESDPKFVEGSGGVSTSSTMLAPFLVWSQQNYTIFLLIARYFWVLLGLQPPRLSRKEKRARKWTSMYAYIFARRAYTEPFYLWNYL